MEVEIGHDANCRPGMDVSLSSPIIVERLFAACTGIQTAEVAIDKKDKKDPSEDQPDSESRYLLTQQLGSLQLDKVDLCVYVHATAQAEKLSCNLPCTRAVGAGERGARFYSIQLSIQ